MTSPFAKLLACAFHRHGHPPSRTLARPRCEGPWLFSETRLQSEKMPDKNVSTVDASLCQRLGVFDDPVAERRGAAGGRSNNNNNISVRRDRRSSSVRRFLVIDFGLGGDGDQQPRRAVRGVSPQGSVSLSGRVRLAKTLRGLNVAESSRQRSSEGKQQAQSVWGSYMRSIGHDNTSEVSSLRAARPVARRQRLLPLLPILGPAVQPPRPQEPPGGLGGRSRSPSDKYSVLQK